jgi:hypothetical protein
MSTSSSPYHYVAGTVTLPEGGTCPARQIFYKGLFSDKDMLLGVDFLKETEPETGVEIWHFASVEIERTFAETP